MNTPMLVPAHRIIRIRVSTSPLWSNTVTKWLGKKTGNVGVTVYLGTLRETNVPAG